MKNPNSKINKDNDFIIIHDSEIEKSRFQEMLTLAAKSKKVFDLTASAIQQTAQIVIRGITALLALTVKQEFKTDSQSVIQFKNITFFITGNILNFQISHGIYSYKFKLDISRIEMFRLTDEICFFLFYTTDGNMTVSVYTSQYGDKFDEIKLTTITDVENKFKSFEVSEVCLFGTVSLTIFLQKWKPEIFSNPKKRNF